LDAAAAGGIESHLGECPACKAEFDEVQRLVVRLKGARAAATGLSLESRVMDRIIHEQAEVIRRLQMRKRIRLLGISGALTAAAALLIVAGVMMSQPDNRILAAETLAQGAKAMPEISSVHIRGKMRTAPHDNFSMIDTHVDFVPIEVWKQSGEKTKWRVEKPGRVAVMNGDSTIMWMKPVNEVMKLPQPTDGAFDTYWLLSLTNVKALIDQELQTALARGWDMKLAHEGTGGEKKLIVTIEAKAEPIEDVRWKNAFIDTSDTRRVYRFDAATKRLQAIQIYLHEKDQDVLIFESESIDYDQPMDSAVFSLKLPDDVVWLKEPGDLPDNVQSFLDAYMKAAPNMSSVHIQGKIRTPPGDNFSAINPDLDFVPIESWKQFGDIPKYRVEKPERVIVMDGDTTVMLMKPNQAVKIPFATPGAFDSRWMLDFSEVRDLVAGIRNGLEAGADLKIANEDVNGVRKLLVTYEEKARPIKGHELLKNKSIGDADARRVYRFDAATKRLEKASIYVRDKDKEALIFETENIKYDKPIDPATFVLDLPKDVFWIQEPAKLPDNEKYEKMTPKESATAFFEACSQEKWDEVKKFWNGPMEDLKKYLGGLQVISIGEPFKVPLYP
jgi:outer membrane lipoprotein-sorting protein